MAKCGEHLAFVDITASAGRMQVPIIVMHTISARRLRHSCCLEWHPGPLVMLTCDSACFILGLLLNNSMRAILAGFSELF